MKKTIKSFFVIFALTFSFNIVKADGTEKVKEDSTTVSKQNKKIGFASFYSKQHHGRKTASGEKFNMFNLTAAHKTLPFGTRIRVTNIKNGKSVCVTVNDRGPFVKSRIIDLSFGAAKKLDMVKSGTAKVSLEVI
jgi:rare lipoprotein A